MKKGFLRLFFACNVREISHFKRDFSKTKSSENKALYLFSLLTASIHFPWSVFLWIPHIIDKQMIIETRNGKMVDDRKSMSAPPTYHKTSSSLTFKTVIIHKPRKRSI